MRTAPSTKRQNATRSYQALTNCRRSARACRRQPDCRGRADQRRRRAASQPRQHTWLYVRIKSSQGARQGTTCDQRRSSRARIASSRHLITFALVEMEARFSSAPNRDRPASGVPDTSAPTTRWQSQALGSARRGTAQSTARRSAAERQNAEPVLQNATGRMSCDARQRQERKSR